MLIVVVRDLFMYGKECLYSRFNYVTLLYMVRNGLPINLLIIIYLDYH